MKWLIVIASGILAAGLLPDTPVHDQRAIYGAICFGVMAATGLALGWRDEGFRTMFQGLLLFIIAGVLVYGIALLEGWVKP